MARDLFAELRDASFRGVPFFVEHNDEAGGRRLDVFEFPYSNQWYVENLGRAHPRYRVDAYLVDDDYLAEAAALAAACNADGPGVLILPDGDGIQASCAHFRRARHKDRVGYIAFEAEFVPEGASSPLQSADYTAQLALDAADATGAAGASLAAQVSSAHAPSWVVGAAVAGLQDALATLDALRTAAPVDPVASLALAGTLSDLYAAAPAAVTPTGLDPAMVTGLFAVTRALGVALPATSAAEILGTALDDQIQPAPAPPRATSAQVRAAAEASAVARIARMALAAAYVAGVTSATYASRPDGVAAKVALVFRFERELSLCRGAADEAAYVALQNLRNAGVAYLEALIVTLAPILTVSEPRELPSLAVAWTLYQDPTRAADLIARNGVRHPSYMPLVFDALAPSAAPT